MERALTDEEKIRKAEEIYYKRKYGNSVNEDYATLNISDKKNYGLFKKIFVQIAICFLIYLLLYSVQDNKNFLSEQVKNTAKEVLSYDINLQEIKNYILKYINDIKGANGIIPILNEENSEENTINENIEETANIDILALSAMEIAKKEDTLYIEEESSISQMQEDADFIKQNYSFVIPVKGVISSRFGTRNPTTPSVPKYHTGLDIAANNGTEIVAAMEGQVIQVSSKGDYGKHLRIQNGEIITLYAHCNKIYVKEGDSIKLGEKIAEVGATGNVTGSHLHFEIRRNNEFVDPEYVIEFN